MLTPAQRTRRCFSLSRVVKRHYPGEELRNKLCMDLAPHYQDALFATEDSPYEVYIDGETLQMFPTRKDARKIRVQAKKVTL